MTKCACCAEETETYPMVSILDFQHTFDACRHCFDNRAEPEAIVIAALQRRTEIADEVFESVRVLFRDEYMTIDAWNCNRFEPEATSPDFCSTDEEERDLRRILDASLDLRREADQRAEEKSQQQAKFISLIRSCAGSNSARS